MSQPIFPKDHSPEDDELQQFEQKFGSFDPPADYPFEPEFNNPPPRPIPSELYRGRYFRNRRMAIAGLLAASTVLMVCSLIPIVRTWGLYVLPLQYLHWIALGLFSLSGMIWIGYALYRGPLVYVEDGIPLVARIATLFLRTKLIVNGVPSVFEYVAVLQHRDPLTGEMIFSTVNYEFPAHSKDNVALSYRVGDYVTAVYLRSNPEKSLRLYGFLDLRPNLGIVRSTKTEQCSVLKLIAGIGAIGGFFFVLAWNVYAFSKYQPLEMTFRDHVLPVAIGAVVLGGGLLAALAWCFRCERSKTEKNNQQAAAEGGAVEISPRPRFGLFGQGLFVTAILLIGAPLLGGGTMLCWAFTLNALGDSSHVKLRPIRVREMWMKTQNYVFREYTIEYEFADDPAKQKQELLTTPGHMASFGPVHTGFAHVRRGLLGWPWVETLTPDAPKVQLFRLDLPREGER